MQHPSATTPWFGSPHAGAPVCMRVRLHGREKQVSRELVGN